MVAKKKKSKNDGEELIDPGFTEREEVFEGMTAEEISKAIYQLKGDELRQNYETFKKLFPKIFIVKEEEEGQQPDGEEKPKPPPEDGFVKPGGWGASRDPHTWKTAQMKDFEDKWKVADDKGKNVATLSTSEQNAQEYIDYYVAVADNVPKPEPGPEPEPEPEPEQPTGTGKYPVPPGFTPAGEFKTGFKHWGRHETNYASGGSGPSERWDCREVPEALNVVAGYEFNIGTEHGERGDDNVDLKFRGNSHNDKSGGWYIPYIEWHVDGSPAGCGIGKEFPHPKTSHLPFNLNVGEGPKAKVDNIGDGNWHGFLAACFNDGKGVPTIYLWYNKDATGKMEDYVLLGGSKDIGNMSPGPVCDVIDEKGNNPQSLQIRMDERPDAQIRNAFAVEVKPPTG
jgi:hypothetical protein